MLIYFMLVITIINPLALGLAPFHNLLNASSISYYETRKKSILVNIELYNVDEQIKNHFY